MRKIKWKLIFKIIAVNVFILLALLVLIELGLKRIQPRSKMVTGQEFIICDHDFYFIPHPILGYYNKPGKFECKLGSLPLSFYALADSSRNTGFKGFKDNCAEKTQLYLFGCSYTWGHGLNDVETMAYKLQSKLGCVQVKNYGIGAGSNVQSYLLLKSLIERGEIPNVVVLNYTFIHDERNAFKGTWRQMWQYMLVDNKVNGAKTDYGNLYIPYAELDENDSLQFKRFPVYEILQKVSLSDKSELISRLAKGKIKEQIFGMDGQDIPPNEKQILSFRVLQAIQDLCSSNGIKFVVTGIEGDVETRKVTQMLKDFGISTLDISVDIENNNYNLMPIDQHPNGRANQIYADKIFNYLVENQFIKL